MPSELGKFGMSRTNHLALRAVHHSSAKTCSLLGAARHLSSVARVVKYYREIAC
jgi:hypothetical protein